MQLPDTVTFMWVLPLQKFQEFEMSILYSSAIVRQPNCMSPTVIIKGIRGHLHRVYIQIYSLETSRWAIAHFQQ